MISDDSTRAVDEDEGSTNAIDLLTADHEEVKAMFEEYDELVADGVDDDEKAALAERICQAITAHATAEEEVFYPAARAAIEDAELLDEAVAEHASAKALIAQIQGMEPSDDLFDATVRLLQEAIEHHVHEEEGELFPRVEESDLDLEALGERVAQRKDEVLAELEEGEA